MDRSFSVDLTEILQKHYKTLNIYHPQNVHIRKFLQLTVTVKLANPFDVVPRNEGIS